MSKPAPNKTPFVKTLLGASSDHRTNQWRIACGCGNAWKPPTTMMATQLVECQKCGAAQVVDYNADDCVIPASLAADLVFRWKK